jgi:hypothetical protein
MAIIGLSGYAGSGKDTIGRMIQFLKCKDVEGKVFQEIIDNPLENEWWLEEQSCWQVKKFAGKLKEIASILTGIPQHLFENQEYKETLLGSEWNYKKVIDGEYFDTQMSIREFLQKLGTDGLREGLHPDVWVNALMADYEEESDKFVRLTEDGFEEWEKGNLPNWVITDCRFPNEAQAIKNAGGIIIRVDRPGYKATNAHVSERALDNWDFDYKLQNGSDLLSLMFSVHNIIKNIGE